MQPPDVPSESFCPDYRGEQIQLGPLVRALVKQCQDEIHENLDRITRLVNSIEKRQHMLRFFEEIRQKTIRLQTVVKWMSSNFDLCSQLKLIHDI